jgi:hypothetical protein
MLSSKLFFTKGKTMAVRRSCWIFAKPEQARFSEARHRYFIQKTRGDKKNNLISH